MPAGGSAGGRSSRVVAQGSYLRVEGTGISTRFDAGGVHLVANSGQKDAPSLLQRFPTAALKKAKASVNREIASGNTYRLSRGATPQKELNLINAELARRGGR